MLISFFVKNYTLLYIVDCEKDSCLTTDDLDQTTKIIFAKFGLHKKIISDAGMVLTSDKFKIYCRQRSISIDQAIKSSYHHQSNGQVEACIKFVKCTIKKCLDSNNGVNLALLQIRSLSIGTGLPSPAMLLFNRPGRGLLPQINREPININNDDVQYRAFKAHQSKYITDSDTHKESPSFLIGSTVAIQCEDEGPWTHGVIKVANSSDHNGRSSIVRVTKTDRFRRQNTKHICSTL